MQTYLTDQQYLTDHDILILRDSFVRNYCEQKGWDKNNLNFEQILEIRSHNEWKIPGMVNS